MEMIFHDRIMDADAIVIGAGAAGLAAARSLARLSLRVIVVEARDRVGGRVWWRNMTQAKAPVELGAEFIHGPAEHTMVLLREAGLTAVATGGEGWTCSKNGELRRDDKNFALASRALKAAHSLAKDESAEQFLRRLEKNEATRQMAEAARAFVEGFEAADPAIASARAIADELRSGVDSTSARPVGGYRLMFEHLHKMCVAAGAQIFLSTVVQRISWKPGAVEVDVRNARGESQTIRARAAIVTLPVGVLRHSGDETEVTFSPELPSVKREALRNIEMGQVVKVTLFFRTPFWERIHEGRYRNGAFFRCQGHPFTGYWTQFPERNDLIVAWAGGPKAIALRDARQTEVIERAMNGFGALLNEPTLVRKEFEGGAMHDWDHDPFARGAYSYLVVGGQSARGELAAPLDHTLFFAGEATSTDDQGGTVNGALETGERAAREVAMSLGTPAT
jgi:monoamine oxidase